MVMDDDGLCLIVRGLFGDDDVRIVYGGLEGISMVDGGCFVVVIVI
jgi:hypothetical protein